MGLARYADLAAMLLPVTKPTAALRLAFYLTGLILFGARSIYGHLRLRLLSDHTFTVIYLVAGLIFFFLACRSTPPARPRWLLRHSRALMACGLVPTLLFAVFSIGDIQRFPQTMGRPNHYWTDAIAATDCMTHLLLHGHNPYKDYYLVDCFTHLHLDARFGTPLQAGAFAQGSPTLKEKLQVFKIAQRHHSHHPVEFESYFSYPAGEFLFPAAAFALGWPEMTYFYLACTITAYMLLAWWAPGRLRPWMALLALGNIAFWDYVMRGFSEGLVVLFLLGAWSAWHRPILSAVLMGVAIATRQDAWFYLPFYAVLVGRADGWCALVRRVVVIVFIFVAINGPFALQAPNEWSHGVLGPLRDAMAPLSVGIVSMQWLPRLPHAAYTALELAALMLCLVYYARVCTRHPYVALVLALVPLLFAWRALYVYFFAPLPILCLWPLLADLRACKA